MVSKAADRDSGCILSPQSLWWIPCEYPNANDVDGASDRASMMSHPALRKVLISLEVELEETQSNSSLPNADPS